MPISQQVFGVTTANGKIYVLGGYNGGSLNTVHEYNPQTDLWERKDDLPVSRYGLGAAGVNGKIYAIGGYNQGYLTLIEEYELPYVPQNLTVTAITDTTLTLTWPVAENATGYDIEADGTIIDNSTNTTFVHSGLLPNSTHSYRYRARFTDGVGDWSPILTVTTEGSSSNDGTLVPNSVDPGDTFNLVLSGTNLTTSCTVTVTYNPTDVQLLDLSGFTFAPDLIVSGAIPDTNITIEHNSAGTVRFTVDLAPEAGKSWSGVLNIVKFRANIANPTINYTLSEN
jgi:hypothetical protein